jgi:hypothetical protein
MFNRGKKQPVAWFTTSANLDGRCQSQGICFACAAGEGDMSGLGTDQPRDVVTRLLDKAAGCTAFGVDRRRIASQGKCGAHSLSRLLPKGGGRVPVKIRTISHNFWPVFAYRFLVLALQKACFLPCRSW